MDDRVGPGSSEPDLATLATLTTAKAAAGLTISVCLPARDEERTIGAIVSTVRAALVEASPLVDEIVVIDDGSTDATASVAAAAGARVVPESAILPEVGSGSGKGNALWKSLHECTGDVICWLDADVRNFGPEFVTRLVTPLLVDPEVLFVKAFYRRPFGDEPSGGGRVTELVARPLLSLLFPKAADVVQPLAGEYAGRRSALETLPFVQGWGVEFGLLVDIVARFGRDALTQVDLGVREHRNRPLTELAPQAAAILTTALRRAGMVEAHGVVDLLRFDDEGAPLDAESVEVRERPPIVTIPAYRERLAARRRDTPRPR